jgi:hypothetical protein
MAPLSPTKNCPAKAVASNTMNDGSLFGRAEPEKGSLPFPAQK